MPNITTGNKGVTGEEVGVECRGRDRALNFPSTALSVARRPMVTPGAHHNQGCMSLCSVCALACAHWLTERARGGGRGGPERGRGGRQTEGAALKKQQWPAPRAEVTCPSLWQERASVVMGPRSETDFWYRAVPTCHGHTYTQWDCLTWQRPETEWVESSAQHAPEYSFIPGNKERGATPSASWPSHLIQSARLPASSLSPT